MANHKQGIWQRIRDWWERPGPRLDAMDGVGVRVVDMTDYHEATIPASRLIAGGQDVDAFLDSILAAREERRLDEADALAADIDLPTLTAYENGDTVVMPVPVHLPAARDGWEVTCWTLAIDRNPETGGAHFYGTVTRVGDRWTAGDYSYAMSGLGSFDHLVDAMEAVEAAARERGAHR